MHNVSKADFIVLRFVVGRLGDFVTMFVVLIFLAMLWVEAQSVISNKRSVCLQ
jgi:hypothetical protein